MAGRYPIAAGLSIPTGERRATAVHGQSRRGGLRPTWQDHPRNRCISHNRGFVFVVSMRFDIGFVRVISISKSSRPYNRCFPHNRGFVFVVSIRCDIGFVCVISMSKFGRPYNRCVSHNRGFVFVVSMRHHAGFVCAVSMSNSDVARDETQALAIRGAQYDPLYYLVCRRFGIPRTPIRNFLMRTHETCSPRTCGIVKPRVKSLGSVRLNGRCGGEDRADEREPDSRCFRVVGGEVHVRVGDARGPARLPVHGQGFVSVPSVGTRGKPPPGLCRSRLTSNWRWC